MALVRRNPIQPGLYWIDLWEPTESSPGTHNTVQAYATWRRAHANAVRTVRVERFDEPLLGGPRRTFAVFQVSAPVDFPFEIGFPDITASIEATPSVVHEPEQGPLDALDAALRHANPLAALAPALLLIFGLYLFAKES